MRHAASCEAREHPRDLGSGAAVASRVAVSVIGRDDDEVAPEVEPRERREELSVDASGGARVLRRRRSVLVR